MKISILFVIDNLQFGGGERVFSQLINCLAPERYRIFLASLPGDNFYKTIQNKHVKFFHLDFSRRFNPFLIFQLKKIIKKNQIMIVHGQGTRSEFYARMAHRYAGTSVYISTIAMPVEGFDVGSKRKMLYRFLDRLSERWVDRFIVVSDELRNRLIRNRGLPPDKVTRIYNGIEIDRYSGEGTEAYRNKIRHELNIDNGSYLIGAVGRLVWQKGFEHLISAMPGVLKIHPDARLIIAGEGPLEQRLRTLCSELKVNDKIIFAGFRDDVRKILSAVDVLAVPSIREGFPMITLEGMAMEKPIIASDISGITEQISDNETGIIVPPQDPGALADAIIKLKPGTPFTKTLALNARKKVESDFSVTGMVYETEKIYQSLINKE